MTFSCFCSLSPKFATRRDTIAIPHAMLQSLHQTRRYPSFLTIDSSPDAGVSGTNIKLKNRGHRSSIRRIKRKRILDFSDVPNEVIQNIYRFHIANGEQDVHRTRLVNKRLASIGLPFAFATISISSKDAMNALFSDRDSPLYRVDLSPYVRCFEIAFVPQSDLELQIEDGIVCFFTKLEKLRFKFTLGITSYDGELQASLSEDSLFRAVHSAPNSSFHRFLSRLQPRIFEWISSGQNGLYIVRVCPMLRSLFCSWSLSSIHLDGICLVEQRNLITWTFALLAERVHIRGPLSSTGLFISDGFQSMGDSRICRLLTLEESSELQDAIPSFLPKEVPILTYGNTLVTLVNWTPAKRRAFKSSLSRLSTVQSRTSTTQEKMSPLLIDGRTLEFSIFRSLAGSIVCMMLFPLFLVFLYRQSQNPLNNFFCLDGSPARWENPHRDLFSLTWYPDRSLMLHPT